MDRYDDVRGLPEEQRIRIVRHALRVATSVGVWVDRSTADDYIRKVRDQLPEVCVISRTDGDGTLIKFGRSPG